MDKNRLKNIIAEEVDRVLQQESGLNELSKLNENKYRDVSDKFKDALDRLPDKAFTTKNIEKLIKKMREKRPDAAMAYTKDAFGWLMKESINEDYSQRARNFRVALRRRLEKMKPGQVIRYGKQFWTAQGKNNFRDSLRTKLFPKGRMTPGQDVVQALKFAVQPDIMKHRGSAGDDMVNAYLKFEGKLSEANRGKVFNAAKKGSFPATIVVVQNGKVIHQEKVSTPESAPAKFNVMQEKYPKALIHLEDNTGKRLFSEGKINESAEKDLAKAKKGAKAKGGGYGPFVKISGNSWKNPKTGRLMHSQALASHIGGFDDFVIEGIYEEYFVKTEDHDCFAEWLSEKQNQITEAEYQGRTVKLNKPMQGDVSKFKVYVNGPKGKVVKVNFGAKGSENRIKKNDPARRKSFRARHNCDNPGPKHKARYWSCRKW